MKKLVVLSLLFCLVLPLAAKEKKHSLEIGYEFSDYGYREPHMEYPIRDSAKKQGISVVYTRHSVLSDEVNDDDPTFASIEFRYMDGKADYDGYLMDGTPFTINDIKDYYTEVALKLGQGYGSGATKFWPYFGVGGRWLRNGEDAIVTSGSVTGQMYQRTSSYFYVPLGLNITFDMGDAARLTLNGQFDWLVHGNQNSHLSGYNFDSISNEQSKGLGLRASAKLEANLGKMGVFVEPFYRYWKIQNSKKVWYDLVDEYGHVIIPNYGYFVEPFNITREYGIRAGITF